MPLNDDPVERLLGELLGAHDRLRTGEARTQGRSEVPLRRPRRRSRRLLVVVVSALVLSASAAAAVVVATRRSAPLAGPLPRQLLGSRYALQVAPDLTAGQAGWCIALLDTRAHIPALADPANCVSVDDGPLVARGGIATFSPSTGSITGWLLYAIVRKSVVGLRDPQGTLITSIASRELLPGWRAAITIATNPSDHRGQVATLVPVNGAGRDLSTTVGQPIALRTEPVTARDRTSVGCDLKVRDARSAALTQARAVPQNALVNSLGTSLGFLSCFAARITIAGRAGVAALLLDSRGPGRRLPVALPGSRPATSFPSMSVSPAVTGMPVSDDGRTFAKRSGDAWIVIETAAPERLAVRALGSLSAEY